MFIISPIDAGEGGIAVGEMLNWGEKFKRFKRFKRLTG